MTTRAPDPRHLYVASAARSGTQLEGDWPLVGFERLVASSGMSQADGEVAWSAQAEVRATRGGGDEIRVHLAAATTLDCECQRCLQAVPVALAIDRWFLFAGDEATAARLDAELDPDEDLDVLPLPQHLDLHALLEDELILALPIVPRHDACPQPLPLAAAETTPAVVSEAAAENPFAGLAALKSRGPA